MDFKEPYAPFALTETIRIVLALAAQLELSMYQLDVKSAFLHVDLDEEVYMEQPEGYLVEGKKDTIDSK